MSHNFILKKKDCPIEFSSGRLTIYRSFFGLIVYKKGNLLSKLRFNATGAKLALEIISNDAA
jgi:hypothetical protein